MIDAYGCGTKTALAELLRISKGTLSNRYLRDTFPADYIIQCALETGTSLKWLATSLGVMHDNISKDIISDPEKKLIKGNLYDSSFYLFDKAFLPDNIEDPVTFIDGYLIHVTENKFFQITDCEWVINIKKYRIRKIALLPKGHINVISSTN
jgi:hypothetical protein